MLQLFEKVLRFPKICFQIKVLKTFKVSTDCHIKTYRSLKQRASLEHLATFFSRSNALYVGFKMKPLRQNQLKVCRKTCWKEQPFIFSFYLINHLFQIVTLWVSLSRRNVDFEFKTCYRISVRKIFGHDV